MRRRGEGEGGGQPRGCWGMAAAVPLGRAGAAGGRWRGAVTASVVNGMGCRPVPARASGRRQLAARPPGAGCAAAAGRGSGRGRAAGMALVLVLVFAALLSYQATAALGGAGRQLRQSAALAARQRLLAAAERQMAAAQSGLLARAAAAPWDGHCLGALCFGGGCFGGYCFQGDFPAGAPPERCRLSPAAAPPWADPALRVWDTPLRHIAATQGGSDLRWVVEFRCFSAASLPLFELTLRAEAPSGERVLLQSLWSAAGRHSWRLLEGT